jgi:hypothetical protein
MRNRELQLQEQLQQALGLRGRLAEMESEHKNALRGRDQDCKALSD